MTPPFTGRHMTAILVAGFGIVIAVNLLMARLAVTTFGGVVVENSYVASQEFNRWLDDAERDRALGWKAHASRLDDGRVSVVFTSAASAPVELTAIARHPLGRLPDRGMSFVRTGAGHFTSTGKLPAGRWTLRLESSTGKRAWRSQVALQ